MYKIFQEDESNNLIETLGSVDKRIYDLFQQGKKQIQIADEMGYTRQEISRRILKMKKMGIKFEKNILHLQKDCRRVFEYAQKGVSVDVIAQKLGMDENEVKKCIVTLRRHGFEFRVTRKKIPLKVGLDEIDEEIIRLRKKGVPMEEIGKSVKRTRLSVLNRIRKMEKNDVDVSKINVPKIERVDEAIKLYVTGFPFYQIAEKLGLSHAGLDKILRCNTAKIMESEICQDIVRLYNSGKDVKQIANEKGLTIRRTHGILERVGIKAREERDDEVIRLFKKGKKMSQIARELDISSVTIAYVLDKKGIRQIIRHPGRKIDDATRKKIVELVQNGEKQVDVAKKFGLSKGTIWKIIRFERINAGRKEKLIKALNNLIKSKHATKEQLAIIAEYYGIDFETVEKVGQNIDKEER